ncbi:MAG: ferritin-like domain-containing protein [Gammaproteobacteria bacterium]|nr:ferritin-like domain-containing protein [Gammaproteobacteria bacterium]MDH5730505.1 ferritin-like domain-containing protein [Gammaproteobacteria bacterium]
MQYPSLFEFAYHCLMQDSPSLKVDMSYSVEQQWLLKALDNQNPYPIHSVEDPGRPVKPLLVALKDLPKRSQANVERHAAFIHALVHIEFNAINLAWDAVYRFQAMPRQYYSDWINVAKEEAYHFSILNEYLQSLGYAYGDFVAHDGLWRMAVDTAHDPLIRMALVPRVMEARGLDVTPNMIQQLRRENFQQAADLLEIIYHDEVGHVNVGSHWFRYLCKQQQLEPHTTFKQLIHTYAQGRLRKPINKQARQQAGFDDFEIAYLETVME